MHSSGFEPGTWAPINRPFVSAWGGAASADTDLDYCSYGYGALEVETLCGGRYRKIKLVETVSYLEMATKAAPVSEMGSGPEYDYPTTGKDEPIPVVTDGVDKAEGGKGTEPVVGEEAGEMDDKTIAAEEALENKEAGEWSEDMASNEPLPGEKEEVLPEELETLPSDRG